MAANFEVKFIVDRVSGNYKIQLTDTSTGFTLVKANTKITFPDGYVIENTDVSNPDISSTGGSVQKNLRLDVNNKPVTGDYTIRFTGYDASDNEYTSQKQFNFTFSEPSILIQDLSDSGVPVVKFKDITSWTQANFTASATTREFNVDYPSTSAVDGQSKTESNTNLSTALEIDMVNSLNYYEGVYDVTLALDITYTHTNGYLSVQYKKNSTQDFPIKRTPSQSDLLNKINQYKENIDEYKVTSPDVYARYAEEYDNILALYSHAVSRYKLGIGDGAQDSIEELLELINDQTVHVYRSTPITPFSIDENDFGANALITKLKSEVGTFDEDGNLQTIAKAFADEVFEVEATDFKAEASKLSTLLAQFGTYDSETNTFSFLATADYFEQVKTYADDNSASAVALDILLAQFGTYDAETETFTFSSTADYFNEVKNYADNDKASAQKLTTLTSQFGSYDPNTNTFTFDNTADYFEQVKTYADENSAAASKISSIGSAFGSFDGNTFNFSEAKITQELNTYTGLDFSNSTYFIDIEAEIDSKPIVFRQASEPATTYATGSIWYDTDDENKVYILVDGTPKVWTLTDDSRIGATATHLTTLTAAFGSYDPATGLTIDTTADYFAEVKSYADTESASATKIENLGAELVTFDSNGNVTGVVLSSSFKSAIDTFVSDEANSALASKVEGLRVDIEGSDGTGGITAQVTSNQQVIAARPKIFRQDDAPATTEPVSSLWFDTNDNNKAYVLLGDGGDPEVFTWTETRDQGLISDISNKPFIFRQDDAPATTNPEGSIWYDTNDGNKLYILISEVWTATQDADIATAQATADARPKVFRQDDAPATTEPEFSIWYDTNDNNLAYILLGDGGDPETFTWTETIDGRVTDLLDFAESKYSLTADANGVVTGLELYSASGPNTTVSTFKITADKFIVRESSTDFIPFTLDGSQLKLDVPLNGVSGSFSGSLTAATGTFSGNVDGNIDGTAASTVKTNAADGATAKGVTDNLTSVVAITSSDIAIVNTGETKTFNDDGTPFYVDNTGQFSLGDKLNYNPTTNTLSITGAVTIESVSGLTKTDVGLANVDNTSVANILDGSSGAFDGNVTGTVDGTSASTVKTNAADGASAKAETDKLTSVVSLTSSDIAIVNSGQTKTYNDAGTPFYVDNTGQFSLGNKLSFDGSNLSVSGTITMSASSTIDGTAASTVKAGAADGANAKDTTDNLESVITITSTKIYQGTGTFGNANTGFYLDDAGQFSLKDKLSFDGTTLSVDGEVTATSGSIGGISLASNKLYVGTGTYNNANTAFYLDDAGQFSLKDKLSWDGSTLSIDGEINSTSGSIGGWEINSSELKSPAVNSVNRLKFSPTAGFIVNDDDNNTALLVNYGALSSLSSTTTGVTFADVSNAEVATWDETVQAGNTLIKIPASNERYIYSSNYLTASFVNDPHGGAYAYEISVDSITGAIATLTGTSTYLKATLALHVEIATDTSFNNVIKDTELWRSDVTGATTITFPGVSNKAISFSISDSVTDVYLRFYWYRMYVVAYNDSITWSPKTFNVSSADANDDLVFLTYNGTTELTNEGVQIINDPTTYFKVDRSNFTSGNPYVDIAGDVKVDGNFTVTGNINLEGDVENSDVTVSNLVERLGEINTAFTLGSSASADVTFAGDVQVDGTLKGPATFTIDPSAYGDATGTVVILGNLQVDGTTTTINSTNVTIDDKILTLSSGAADSTAANDSGIEIDGASAYFKYFHSGTKWVSNKNIEAGTFIGALSGNASTASQLITARTISLTGDITGSASFDGTADVSIATTVAGVVQIDTDNQVLGRQITLGDRTSNSTYNPNLTGLTVTSVAEIRTSSTDDPPALAWHYESQATRHILLASDGTLKVVAPTSENSGVANFQVVGNSFATNSVGINTTSTTYNLNVNGSAYMESARVKFIGGSSYNENIRMYAGSNDYSSLVLGAVAGDSGTGVGQWTLVRYPSTSSNKFTIRHNASDHIIVSTGGNVGIGSDPSYKLDVVSSTVAGSFTAGDGGYTAVRFDGDAGATIGSLTTHNGIVYIGSENSGGTGSNGEIRFEPSSGGAALYIDSSKRVGIGTTSPQTSLHNAGGFYTSGRGSVPTGKGLEMFYYTLSDTAYIESYDYANSLYKPINYSASKHCFLSGSVGINTTSPSEKLHVHGNLKVGTGATGNENIQLHYSNSTGGYGAIRFYQSGSNNQTIHAFSTSWQGGNVYTSSGAINITGDNGVTFGGWNVPDVVFVTGGTNYFRNSVGIGTTSPSAKLHLYVNSTNDDTFHIYNGSVRTHLLASESSNGVIYMRNSSNSNTVRINASGYTYFNGGNVGIGTTSPSAKLEVNGYTAIGTYAAPHYSQSGMAYQVIKATGGSDTQRAMLEVHSGAGGTKGIFQAVGSNNTVYVGTLTNSGLIVGNDVVSMAFNTAGNVGIGTTSPSGKFEIKSAATTYTTAPAITFTDNAGVADSRWIIGNIATNYGSFNIAQAANASSTSYTPRITILDGGNVGIGTTSPSHKLHVNGDIRQSKIVIRDDSIERYDNPVDNAAIQFNYVGYNSTNSYFRDVNVWNGKGGLVGQFDGSSSNFYVPNGGVGIGTTSPSAKLHTTGKTLSITSSSSWGQSAVANPNDSEVGFVWAAGGSGYPGITSTYTRQWIAGLSPFGTGTDRWSLTNRTLGANTAITVLEDGKVGIGTTAPANKLHIKDGAIGVQNGRFFLGGESGTANDAIEFYKSGNTVRLYVNNGAFGGSYSAGSAALELYSGSSYAVRLNGNGNSYINSGNVGIGTTSPSYKLQVQKTSTSAPAIMVGGSYSGGPRIQTYGLDADANAWMGLGTDMGGNPYEHSVYFPQVSGYDGVLTFGSYNGTTYSTKMVIRSTGRVGIGTTSPLENFHVNGSTISGAVGTTGTINRTGITNYLCYEARSTSAGNEPAIGFHKEGIFSMYLQATNSPRGLRVLSPSNETAAGLRVEGDVVAFYSDMRLKTKIGDIQDPIGKIQALSGFYYEPNEIAQSYGYEVERRIGLSAQDVKEVVPEAVHDAPIGDGYMAVDYAKLVPVLVEAIKEQQKQIDELKARLDA